MRSLWIAAASVAVAAACAESRVVAADDVGTACASSGGDVRALSRTLARRKTGETFWVRVDAPSQLARGRTRENGPPPIQEVTFDGATPLGGSPARASMPFTKRTVDEVVSEVGRGASVVMVSGENGAGTAAAIRKDGTVVFLGECAAERVTPLFQWFVERRRAGGDTRSAGDILVAFASEPALVEELERVERPETAGKAWADVAPNERRIDPDGANPPPADVMAQLDARWVHYDFPPEWRSFDATLATFVPGVGWNAAVPFGLDSPDPAVVSYVGAARGLEVWALDAKAGLARPLARLAVLGSTSIGTSEHLRLRARVEAASLDELLRQARAGTAVFALERGVAD